MDSVYGSIFVLLLGACIGSFLNVVIYRWPRNLSIGHPLRSFCPTCKNTIAWYDNIPVISYLLLRGRCRRCNCPISMQYPLVELTTALVFLMTYDTMFVARQRIGIGELSVDWPIFIAHLVLWGGLIAMAVMDLEAYLVDIRITWIISFCGLLGHALWTPAGSSGWLRPNVEQATWAVSVLVGLVIGGWLFMRREQEPDLQGGLTVEEPPAEELFTTSAEPRVGSRWVWLTVPIALVLAYLLAMFIAGEQAPFERRSWSGRFGEQMVMHRAMTVDEGMIRVGLGMLIVFIALVSAAGHPQPQADTEIVEAIHAEAAGARRKALWELKLLSPAILLSFSTMFLLMIRPGLGESLAGWLHYQPVGQWQPLWGLATAITGWVLGGAVGWLARIGFTLLFGKEALGMGDVHILAAAGAVAGWPIALFGFFLAAPLSLLAIVVIHLRRQSRALPYGPWLGLAFLLAATYQDRILLYLGF